MMHGRKNIKKLYIAVCVSPIYRSESRSGLKEPQGTNSEKDGAFTYSVLSMTL